MLADVHELIGAAALSLPAVADMVSSLLLTYAGGMPDGLGPGGLAAGAAAAAAAAAGAAAYGPHLPSVSAAHRAIGYHHYRDSAGNPYWPGISAIPADRIVYQRKSDNPERGGPFSPSPLPVGPRGMPIHPPPPDLERGIAAQTTGGRG